MTVQEDLPNGEHAETPIYNQLRDEWPQLYAKHEVDKFLSEEEARREAAQQVIVGDDADTEYFEPVKEESSERQPEATTSGPKGVAGEAVVDGERTVAGTGERSDTGGAPAEGDVLAE